ADPSRPSIAAGPPAPVVDFTGLHGIYELNLDLKSEVALDMFTSWQRFLQEHCGLKLESRKSQLPVLVVEKAERIPTPASGFSKSKCVKFNLMNASWGESACRTIAHHVYVK